MFFSNATLHTLEGRKSQHAQNAIIKSLLGGGFPDLSQNGFMLQVPKP